jgi:pimeloyl-ACP methyl ester carboxylesterase
MRNHFIHAGEGKSYSTMTYEDMADDVIAFADSLGFKTFDLCGYCFGGRIAVVTAAKYPDRVSSLQIIETSFGRF